MDRARRFRRPAIRRALPAASVMPILVLVVTALAVLAAPVPARAAPPERVLPPEASSIVQAAFARLSPDWTFEGASLGATEVTARLCPDGGGACVAVRLSDPEAGCPDAAAGPWCLAFPDGDPPGDVRARLFAALAADGSDPWARPRGAVVPGTQGPGGAAGAPAAEDVSKAAAAAASLVLLCLPLLLGLPLGRRLRCRWHRAPGRALVAVALLVLPPVAGLLLAFVLTDWAAWDLVALSSALGLSVMAGLLASPGPAGRRDLAGLLLGLVLALGLAEGAARVLLPDPGFPWEGRLPGLRAVEVRLTADLECSGLFPGQVASPVPERSVESRVEGAASRSWRVLHVGDSLVAESGPRGMAEAFPAALQDLRPGQAHVNGGYANTGTDFQARVALAWTDGLLPADRVVLHWYSGNDDLDLDRLYGCCAGGPLFAWADAGPEPRCPGPSLLPSPAALLGRSPTPYPLRRATAFSRLARHAHLALTRLSQALLHPSDLEAAWPHLRVLLPWLRDRLAARGIALTVDALPSRTDLHDQSRGLPPGPIHDRFLDLCRDLGLQCLDAREALLPAVRESGTDPWYLPGDIHLSPAGHRRLAEWLAPLLDPPR